MRDTCSELYNQINILNIKSLKKLYYKNLWHFIRNKLDEYIWLISSIILICIYTQCIKN